VVSWIHVEDLCRLILFALNDADLSGPVNATAPNPVTNAEFTKALAGQLRRPAFLPVPGFAIKARFGGAAVVLLTGQRVLPAAALAAGFKFEHETIEDAFAGLYPRED